MGLPYQETTILQKTVSTAVESCQNVIVVVGHHGEQAKKLLEQFSTVKIISNPNYRNGQFSSAKIGIQSVCSSEFFITLGDLPFVDSSLYYEIYRFYQKTETSVVFPCHESKQGHPVLIHSSLIPQILKQPDTASMKKTLLQFSPAHIDLNYSSVISDIDTPQEYEKMLKLKK